MQHSPLRHICEELETHVGPFSKRHPNVITRQRASEFIIREAYLFIKLTTVLASFHYSQGLENSNTKPGTDSYTRIKALLPFKTPLKSDMSERAEKDRSL